MTLSAEVQARIGQQRLIELTNNDGTATTINTTILDNACADAEGMFRIHTGLEPDTTQDYHISLLIIGVMAYLELYKGSNYNLAEKQLKYYENKLNQLRKKSAILWYTNSKLDPSSDTNGSKPDMDRLGELNKIKLTPNNRTNYDILEDN